MTNNKKIVNHEVDVTDVICGELETLDKRVRNEVDSYIKRHKYETLLCDDLKNIVIKFEHYGGYDGGLDIKATFRRYETETEYEQRLLKEEKKHKKEQENKLKELKQLESLAKKHGKKLI